jgi:hypothetical protein
VPQIAVGTAGVAVLPRNAKRKSMTFENVSAAGTIWLDNCGENAVQIATASLRLRAGDFIELDLQTDGKSAVLEQWSAIGDAVALTLAVLETFD